MYIEIENINKAFIKLLSKRTSFLKELAPKNNNNKKHCAAITPIMPGQTSTSEWRLIRTTNEGDWMK